MKGLIKPTPEDLDAVAIDITDPNAHVEVKLDKHKGVLWVNVGNTCVLRICQMTTMDMHFDLGHLPESNAPEQQ